MAKRSKQRAVLDHVRAGTFGPAVQDEIGDQSFPALFTQTGVGGWLGAAVPASDAVDLGGGGGVYKSLEQIAARYDLSDEEFVHSCTIPASASETGRVFYPYHLLSKPLVEELSWAWATLYSRAKFMLRTFEGCVWNATSTQRRPGTARSRWTPYALSTGGRTISA